MIPIFIFKKTLERPKSHRYTDLHTYTHTDTGLPLELLSELKRVLNLRKCFKLPENRMS